MCQSGCDILPPRNLTAEVASARGQYCGQSRLAQQGGEGKKFAFSGGLTIEQQPVAYARPLIVAGAGSVQDDVTPDLDYLVVGTANPNCSMEKKANKLNSQGKCIKILDAASLADLLTPTRDESIEILRSGAEGVSLWNTLQQRTFGPVIDLSGSDLSGADISGAFFRRVSLNAVNFTGIRGTQTRFYQGTLKNAICDSADLRFCTINGAKGCSFAGAILSEAVIDDLTDCNFSGAQLKKMTYFANIRNCVFEGTNLAGTKFTSVALQSMNFRKANFSECKVESIDLGRADLYGATLVGASFVGANLSGCNLENADLSEATFSRARFVQTNLTGAVCRKALFDSVDFTDAIVTNADFTGASAPAAITKSLDLSTIQGWRIAGPHLQDFEKITQRNNIDSTTVVIVAGGRSVTLTAQATQVRWMSALRSGSTRVNSLTEGMMHSAVLFPDAELRLDSVVQQPCGLDPRETSEGAVRAWCESFGRHQPDVDEMNDILCDEFTFSQKVLNDLRSGPPGITNWNSRSVEERRRATHLHEADLSFTDLSSADLQGLFFKGTNFNGSKLNQASLLSCNLHLATFKQATIANTNCNRIVSHKADFRECVMTKVRGSGAILSQARFDQSSLTEVDFRNSDLQKAYFGNAILTDCDFAKCDLRGADFSSATLSANFQSADLRGAIFKDCQLANCCFEQAKYNEKTRFPEGFVPPKEMRWSSKLPNPSVNLATTSLAAISFDDFMQALSSKCQPDKLEKALKMLKVDRFKLFAARHGVYTWLRRIITLRRTMLQSTCD